MSQGVAETGLDHDLSALHRTALPIGDVAQLDVVREIVDGLVAVLEELLDPLASDLVERAHVVLRRFGPAAGHERAVVGVVAVIADVDVGQRALEHPELAPDLARDLG